ncbi:MAG: hypothetical protein AB7Q16_07555 [Vicinamibacterales bacterium]
MRALVAILILASGLPLSAITVKPLSFVELVDESMAIVHGRVTEVHGQWTADRGGIESLLRVEAFDYLKGDLGDTITVRVPGGQVGTIVNIIPGAARFSPGDRVVLFLTATGPAIPVVTGTTQGVFRVTADPRSGELVVIPPVVGTAGAPGRLVRGDSARRPMSMAAFGAAVQRAQVAR